MKQEKIYHFSPEIQAISFSRGHVFNDSILYLQLGNFSILNVNDAGFNWSIKHAIGDVDMVCMQFGPASAYPATWTHIDEKSKIQLNKNRNNGMLRMIKQVLDATNAKYFIPFANFNELYHKEHLKFVLDSQSKNRANDVIKFLEDYPVKVLDILPGESWNGKTEKFARRSDREKLFNKEYLIKYLENIQNKPEFVPKIPFNFDLTGIELKEYFESFSDSHLAKRVGNYTVSLTLEHLKKKVHGIIKFNNGKITYKETKNQNKANLIMRCPGHFVQEIIRNDLYWDELVSGFWCEFSRDPDIYNVAFWQLLHVPWRARKKDGKTNSRQIEIKTNTSIADIIEKGGSNVIEIFERNGLFCVGCDAAIGETIEEGCEIHGIDEKQRDKLILELGETVN
jgi:CMP-N-acetylneuraminate monooxygenase